MTECISPGASVGGTIGNFINIYAGLIGNFINQACGAWHWVK
jgi:hypothetical protein